MQTQRQSQWFTTMIFHHPMIFHCLINNLSPNVVAPPNDNDNKPAKNLSLLPLNDRFVAVRQTKWCHWSNVVITTSGRWCHLGLQAGLFANRNWLRICHFIVMMWQGNIVGQWIFVETSLGSGTHVIMIEVGSKFLNNVIYTGPISWGIVYYFICNKGLLHGVGVFIWVGWQ